MSLARWCIKRPALGLGKTLFNSSVCYFENLNEIEIYLTERLTRKKASGNWPSEALLALSKKYDLNALNISENRDVEEPAKIEELLNKKFPFFEYLRSHKLENFSSHFNPRIKFSTHHIAHAYAASYMSPFEKAIVVVIDGAGSRAQSFNPQHDEINFAKQYINDTERAEERSAYLFNNGQLLCIDKKFQEFVRSTKHPEHYFSEGLGTFYEKISELIFNSKRSAGKVMGLAALGKCMPVQNSNDYLENLDWSLRFSGKSKKDWESSPNFKVYCDTAADVQNFFENDYISYITELKKKFPDYTNLIITGGCALNCTSNMKLFNAGIFDNIYIPPFPGDESIGLGVAFKTYYEDHKIWQPNPYESQHGYLGPKSSIPSEKDILSAFNGYNIERPDSITEHCAKILADGEVIAWFQGRSKSGPRALGNRSILCRPDKKNVKDYLNNHIKFREQFRPYGCSTLFEKSHLYFEVPENFNNPYMSFATMVKPLYKDQLKEVTHSDGTSRMQTVRKGQNHRFYELLKSFGAKSGIYCLLNTSLNVMGEPIVENIADAKNFLDTVPVFGLAIGDYFIKKNTK